MKAVDDVIATVQASGVECKSLTQALALPTESEMDPRDKYTTYNKHSKGYRKSVHKVSGSVGGLVMELVAPVARRTWPALPWVYAGRERVLIRDSLLMRRTMLTYRRSTLSFPADSPPQVPKWTRLTLRTNPRGF